MPGTILEYRSGIVGILAKIDEVNAVSMLWTEFIGIQTKPEPFMEQLLSYWKIWLWSRYFVLDSENKKPNRTPQG